MVSPMPAPNIINPMIEVPHTRLPSFSTSTLASKPDARVTNFALARACTPRLRSEEHTSELQSPMRNTYAVFLLKQKTKKKHKKTYKSKKLKKINIKEKNNEKIKRK